MDRSLLFNDTTLRMLCIRFGMLAYHIDALDNGTILIADHFKDLSGLSLVIPGIYIDGIAFLNVYLFHNAFF